jgi:hypothetical protein
VALLLWGVHMVQSGVPGRPSHGVMRFLLERGYDVTPVNPDHLGEPIHGRTVVATLDEAPPLDMVDVFRRRVCRPGGRCRDPAWGQERLDAAQGDRRGCRR